MALTRFRVDAPIKLVLKPICLLAVYNHSFLLSQSLMPAFTDLLLGYVLYRSLLVPRILPRIAFVGAPLLLASDIAVFFGAYDDQSALAGLAAIPVVVFEFSIGLRMLVQGFNAASPLFTSRANRRSVPGPNRAPVSTPA